MLLQNFCRCSRLAKFGHPGEFSLGLPRLVYFFHLIFRITTFPYEVLQRSIEFTNMPVRDIGGGWRKRELFVVYLPKATAMTTLSWKAGLRL